MMENRCFTAFGLCCLVLMQGFGFAEETGELARRTKHEIAACKALSKPYWDSGVTATMREGSVLYSDCLKKIVVELAEKYYTGDAFAPEGIEKRLETAEKSLGALYWPIYNDVASCSPACGTIHHVMPGGAYSGFLENLIQTMVSRLELETPAEFDGGPDGLKPAR